MIGEIKKTVLLCRKIGGPPFLTTTPTMKLKKKDHEHQKAILENETGLQSKLQIIE
ncbi:MAG TPA: hypothetical protein P5086_06215 [Prolixibacteraceae bacterium]|jgi:hypothetical protein|nr:hypothetical protein [Bacteroidales bacterium]HNQ37294.1 hypothetical protein [Prolixibacteraceae bacterium]HOY50577.1 hypothetical protein [Prolixibacteraceae bacterium]HPJ79733.1 hypothetical protein [Prolixibacteraceae bacterium]HRV88894.1 hypothetical protein [Prolixibacteraceae bacterium]